MSGSTKNNPKEQYTISTLMSAVYQNNIKRIRTLLQKHGLPPNESRTTDYDVLRLAINERKSEIAKLLINAGCRVNDDRNVITYQLTSLALAFRDQNEEIATLLLEKGANLTAGDDSHLSVFHKAAQNLQLKMLKLLLRFKFNIDYCSRSQTPFQFFLSTHQCYLHIHEKEVADVVRFFLENGASINFKIQSGNTVLHSVVNIKQNDMIEHVLKATDDVNVQNDNKATALHSLLDHNYSTDEEIVQVVKLFIPRGAKLDIQDNSGNTVCHLAAKKKFFRTLQLFLQFPRDINLCNKEGNTILHCILKNSLALCNNAQYHEMVDQILKYDSLKLLKNNAGKTPLLVAAEYKQTQVIKNMLSEPVNINETDAFGNSVLYLFMNALANKNVVPDKKDFELVKKIISMGANPAISNPASKLTPLHFAFRLKDKNILLLMLESNFNFDKFEEEQNRSVLHLLCGDNFKLTDEEEKYNADVATMCIKKGAKVDVKDHESKTPLYWAVLMRRKYMVLALLQNGADPNLLDNEGGTILENLMKEEVDVEDNSRTSFHYPSSKTLIPHNIERDSEIALMLLSNNAIAEKMSKGQVSIYHYCTANSHLDMLLKIVSYIKDPNIHDSQKNTIIHALLANNFNKNKESDKKVTEIVGLLLSKGAEVGAANKKGETLLHLAAKAKNFELVKALLERKADVTALDKEGNTVVHFACMLECKSNDSVEQRLTELFVSMGCNINARNKKGMTPLLVAVQSSSVDMTEVLIRLNAKIDCVENENRSMSIHLAAESSHRIIIEKLIECGADVNFIRGDGKTALHLSAVRNYPEITELLLMNGAYTDFKDNEGKTPLHLASSDKNRSNIDILLQYGADVNVKDNFPATPFTRCRLTCNSGKKLGYHGVALEAAGMFFSKRNKSYMKRCIKQCDNSDVKKDIEKFKQAAINEILTMEKVTIAPRVSLVDVLRMSTNKLSIFKNNEDFQKLINSEGFYDKFPIYSDLVKACYRKGVIRSNFSILARDAFRKIIASSFPDACCDEIFSYLENEELYNLDLAANINVEKRKRMVSKNKSSNAKRLKLMGASV